MQIFEPIIRENPKLAEQPVPSAWFDIPTILKDIIVRVNVTQNKALEFGVEYGYSTSALANYFRQLIGVDTFQGDKHSGNKNDHLSLTSNLLKDWENILLVQSDYKDFINDNNDYYDLIHIDIVHDYEPTYECGEWAINHSKVTIFHDTESFSEVKHVCLDLSEKYNVEFYNYPHSHGLGILVNNHINL